MNVRFALVLVAVLTVAAAGTFLLADLPLAPPDDPAAVDTDAPPAALASAAIAQYDHVDYTYEWWLAGDDWRQFALRVQVDNTDRQAMGVSHMGDGASVTYRDETGAWHRPSGGSWRRLTDDALLPRAPFPGDANPFDADALDGTAVSVVRANASVVVLRVDVPLLSAARDGHTDLVVERESGVLRRAVERSPDHAADAVYAFSDVGTTDVERPAGAGSAGLDALLSDLLTYTP